jgi:hypothetical protein
MVVMDLLKAKFKCYVFILWKFFGESVILPSFKAVISSQKDFDVYLKTMILMGKSLQDVLFPT